MTTEEQIARFELMLTLDRFEWAYSHEIRDTQYTLVQVFVAWDEYRAAETLYSTVAARAEEFFKPYRDDLFYLFCDDVAPESIVKLYKVANGKWSEPAFIYKRMNHSSEVYPIAKWLAAARKYSAQTARIEKAMKGL